MPSLAFWSLDCRSLAEESVDPGSVLQVPAQAAVVALFAALRELQGWPTGILGFGVGQILTEAKRLEIAVHR